MNRGSEGLAQADFGVSSGVALADIVNFVVVDARIASAGQPSEAQLREIAESGFEAVVNLGILDPEYCLPDEKKSAQALGLHYVHIPVTFTAPKDEDFERFRQTMRRLAGRKVFVHCAMNMRVSCFLALYGEAELGWSREQADEHVRLVWEPDDVWRGFLERTRAAFAAPPVAADPGNSPAKSAN
jgi:protein tyrosine phosphatase (PTP) superfamily phosphohydrolase (DUF442 family)